MSPEALWYPIEAISEKEYRTSFYKECRAYGRLEECNMGHRVARCYGYLIFTQDQEEDLISKGLLTAQATDGFTPPPLKALVKELIESETPFTPHMIPAMIDDIQMINKVGIFVFDVRERNYLDGLLLEFGSAMTVPHDNLTKEWIDSCVENKRFTEELPKVDEDDFDEMIDDYNEATTGPRIWIRISPNWNLKESLRKTRYDVYHYEMHYPRYRPELYDWEKGEHRGDPDKPPLAYPPKRRGRKKGAE